MTAADARSTPPGGAGRNPRAVRPSPGSGCLGVLALLAVACGDSGGGAGAAVECVRVEVADLALSADPDCGVAANPLARSLLPDLSFTPDLCFRTAWVPLRAVAAGTAASPVDDGESVELAMQARSGIDSNPVAGTGLAPFPGPIVDRDGNAHAAIAFTAASAISVASPSGRPVGTLVARDTGWAEVKPPSTLPSFVSERLVIVGGDGEAFRGVTGEVFATGDEFAGIPARGSLCGPGLFGRLARAAGG